MRRRGRGLSGQEGAQSVEWLALGLLVVVLLTAFTGAVRGNKSLPGRFTSALGRLLEQAVPRR